MVCGINQEEKILMIRELLSITYINAGIKNISQWEL